MPTTDDLISEVGGMSFFQLLMIITLKGPNILAGWTMLTMSFAGVKPNQWWCVGGETGMNRTNSTLEYCPSSENYSDCMFVYDDEKHTVVKEWDLVCERSEIPQLMTSIQMAGVLVGALLSGQTSDVIGRKKTYLFVLPMHAAFNLVAAFSVSWQMFIVMRFFIGVMIGALLALNFPYLMEFLGPKWRPLTSVIPTWATGVGLFALSCWLRPNWSTQHIIPAVLHVPFIIGLVFTPESLRWLAVHGHIDEAEEVVEKIARYNRKTKPANTREVLKKIYEEELKFKESGKKYTYIDIYRGWRMFLTSINIQVEWTVVSFVTYGLAFGASHLSGNFYVNLFLLGTIGILGYPIAFFLQIKFGRKLAVCVLLAFSTLCAFGIVIATSIAPVSSIGTVTTTLALLCRLGVSSAWSSLQVLSGESYPTTIRNLGYGAANTTARIGGIVSPYAFAMGGLKVPFAIVGSLTGVCGILTLFLKETRGTPLPDNTNVTRTLEQDSTKAEVKCNESKM